MLESNKSASYENISGNDEGGRDETAKKSALLRRAYSYVRIFASSHASSADELMPILRCRVHVGGGDDTVSRQFREVVMYSRSTTLKCKEVRSSSWGNRQDVAGQA